ncbi:MAG: phosphatidylinositol mannoside acyltransferase [Acidimicrobiales bacterium]
MAGQARVALFKSIGAVLERLPERFDVALARWLAVVVGRRTTGARRHLGVNLAHALAATGAPLEPGLLESFVDRGFASYGQYWAESAKLPALSSNTITSRFVIAEGLEHLLEAKALGKGIVIALPHIGSWEWGGSFLASLDMPMTAVAEELEPRELFEWFKAKRQAIGINIEPLDAHAGTVLLQTLRDGGVVGLLCDRDLQDNGLMVDFFGERVTIPAGPATLALRTGATLVAAACYSGPGRDHFAVVTAPINTERTARLRDDVNRVTQAIAHDLEGLIRRAPEQWHVLQPRFSDS